MEQQHIGQGTPLTNAAGVDPASIPGLVPARPEQGGAAKEPAKAREAPEDRDSPEIPPGAAETTAVDDSGPEDESPEGEVAGKQRETDDGPVFEVSDRRGAIVADATGITFRLDTEEAEFRWAEIKAVEIDTPRFGKRFGVTVYTSPQRWFDNDVEASSRSLLKEWAAELDAVLDVRFDTGGPKGDTAEKAEKPDNAAGKAEKPENTDKPGNTDKAEKADAAKD
ncbi:hypothetical protein ABT354_33165 [Streptomyces sp. NPDC000594]|uniref:hypothetical protein n=1 Tax=Streptomyces sp. NPDC000594 TaxID=3154261 RepID=UPI00332FCF90